jgi:hypothetical protein
MLLDINPHEITQSEGYCSRVNGMLLDMNPYEITQSEGYCSSVNGMLLDINPHEMLFDVWFCIIIHIKKTSDVPELVVPIIIPSIEGCCY